MVAHNIYISTTRRINKMEIKFNLNKGGIYVEPNKKYKIRVRADFSEIMEVEATNFEEAEVKASQKFLDEFDPSTMSMSSLDTEEWKENV
jgi:hypothetical protein